MFSVQNYLWITTSQDFVIAVTREDWKDKTRLVALAKVAFAGILTSSVTTFITSALCNSHSKQLQSGCCYPVTTHSQFLRYSSESVRTVIATILLLCSTNNKSSVQTIKKRKKFVYRHYNYWSIIVYGKTYKFDDKISS